MSGKANSIFKFWQELKRRKVFRVVAMYAATAFIIMEAADIILPRLGLPDWTVTLFIILLLIGFPVAAVLSWIYDITPEGIFRTKKEESESKNSQEDRSPGNIINANNIVIAVLFVTVCILLYPKIFRQTVDAEIVEKIKRTNSLIAVLPFTNSKPDAATDYLGFALADQIIGELVYLNHVTVRSSGSVRKYVDRVIDPISVGDSLKVDYVLTGNYLNELNKVRLNVELVEVNSNSMIWREDIEVDFNSAFELQDIVAQRVVDGLDIQFTPKEIDTFGKDIPNNPLAYEYYLRSISYPFSIEGDRMAIDMLNQAIELDSSYAPAYAQLAERTHRLVVYELHGPEELKIVENLYLKALSLRKDYISVLANLAQLYTETAREEKAVELIKQIMDINSNHADAHFSLGYLYRYAGMNREAVLEMEKAISIDPENPKYRSIIVSYLYSNRLDLAFETSQHYEESEFIFGFQGAILLRMGKDLEAVEYMNRCLSMNPDGSHALWVTGLKAYIEGNVEEGLEAARKFEVADTHDGESWYHIAGIYALLRDKEGAIRVLRRAVDAGFFNYPFMLTDYFLDPVRDDENIQTILQEAKQKHLDFRKNNF